MGSRVRLPLPRTFVERAISGFAGYASFFDADVPKIFASVDDAALQAAALADDVVKRNVEGKQVVRVIIVKNKLVNIVVR